MHPLSPMAVSCHPPGTVSELCEPHFAAAAPSLSTSVLPVPVGGRTLSPTTAASLPASEAPPSAAEGESPQAETSSSAAKSVPSAGKRSAEALGTTDDMLGREQERFRTDASLERRERHPALHSFCDVAQKLLSPKRGVTARRRHPGARPASTFWARSAKSGEPSAETSRTKAAGTDVGTRSVSSVSPRGTSVTRVASFV